MNTATATETTTTRVADVKLDQVIIVTRGGKDWGRIEVEAVEQFRYGTDVWVHITGYRYITAGICGPWSADYRAEEEVEVQV